MRDKIGNALIRLGRRVRKTKYANGGFIKETSAPIYVDTVGFAVPAEEFRRAVRRTYGGQL